jgi:hypothetical protein
MRFVRNRRVVLAIGAGLALIEGLGIGLFIMMRDHGSNSPPPASKGGLVVEMGSVDEAPSANGRQLRCFVRGQFVGMASLVECAKKNGVSTQGLDVGLDANGALAAADGAGVVVTQLAPDQIKDQITESVLSTPVDPKPAEVADAKKPAVAACMRFTSGEWRKVGDDLELTSCARTLFDGKCEKDGSASYGRWGTQTLRLVPGKIEQSADNKSFAILADQTMPGCHLP